MKSVKITELELRNFRIHKHIVFTSSANSIALIGPNGIGKTSILEAISMLNPGRGLLNANPGEILCMQSSGDLIKGQVTIKTNADFNFRLSIESNTLHDGSYRGDIHQCFDNDNNIKSSSAGYLPTCSRKLFINEKAIKRQVDLLHWVDVLWLTANMQCDLTLSSVKRRRFFDRAAFYITIEHAAIFNLYEKLLRERLKLLMNNCRDEIWLEALELQISDAILSIARNRLLLLDKIHSSMEHSVNINFPKIEMRIDGEVERFLLESGNINDVHTWTRNQLKLHRAQDRKSGRTNFGAHRSDFVILCKERQIAITQLSRGEQKMVLLGIIYGIATMITKIRDRPPIILFDDVTSFLDSRNTSNLIESFSAMSSQIWLTSAVNLPFAEHTMEIVSVSDMMPGSV